MPPLSNIQRQPLEVQAQVDYMLSCGKTCADIAAWLAEQNISTSAPAVGRYRKNIWLPKIERQKGTLALLEIVDPADPAKSLGRVNIALAQTLLKDNLELLVLDEHVSPDVAIPLVLKAIMAQEKASKAIYADVMAALKGHQLDEIRKAADGELFVKQDDKLVRVEFINAPQKPKKPRTAAKKTPAITAKKPPAIKGSPKASAGKEKRK